MFNSPNKSENLYTENRTNTPINSETSNNVPAITSKSIIDSLKSSKHKNSPLNKILIKIYITNIILFKIL